jgi:hypothetical protein
MGGYMDVVLFEGEGSPTFEKCPADGCENTQDLLIQEATPGHSWVYSSSVCEHWGFIWKKTA